MLTYDVNRCKSKLVMLSVKNCVISGFVVGGIAFTGYHLYQRYKENEETTATHFVHPDCNLAVAAVKRAVEKRIPKENAEAVNISLELQIALLETEAKKEKDFILEKIASILVNDAIEMAKKTITEEERITRENQNMENDVVFASRKLVEHAIMSAKEILMKQNFENEKFVIAFVAKALVDGAIQSAKATVITENIEKEQIATSFVAKALVEDAIQSAKAIVIAENEKKESELVFAARGLVYDVIKSAKATLVAENEQQQSTAIDYVATIMVNSAIQYAQAVIKAKNFEAKQLPAAPIDCQSALELAVETKIHEQKSLTDIVDHDQEQLLLTARSLVDHVIKSAQKEIFRSNSVTRCDSSTVSSSSSLQNSEDISDGELFSIYRSSEEMFEPLANNEHENDQFALSSNEAIKDVLNSFLSKIQEVANSSFAQKKSDEILKVKHQLGILWPIIATWLPSRDKVTENEVSDEKVQSEERSGNSVTTTCPSSVSEDAASTKTYHEEKTCLSGQNHLLYEQVSSESIKENVGSLFQTIDALSAFLFAQNKSEDEIQQAQEELRMLWPILVDMRNSLP